MKIDYHVHTEHSWDASGSMEDYCQRAIELGIDEIGFADHLDLDPSDRACGFYNPERISAALNKVHLMFDQQIVIKKGIEITYQEEYHDQIEKIVNEEDYDFTLAGIHLSKGIFYTSRLAEDHYVKFRDAKSAFRNYFNELYGAIESGLIDVVAHIDVIKRHSEKIFGPFNPRDFVDEFDKIMQFMIDKGIALEINSGDVSNFNRQQFYPSDWLLKRFYDLGGRKIIFGSDAHSIDALSGGFETAKKKTINCGFEGWSVFTRRKSKIVPFE